MRKRGSSYHSGGSGLGRAGTFALLLLIAVAVARGLLEEKEGREGKGRGR